MVIRRGNGCGNAKQEGLCEILVECLGCEIAIFVPPSSGAINLDLCPLGDADVHVLLAVATRKLSNDLFGRNRFTAISLSNGEKQFCLLLRREIKASFIVLGEDDHRGSLVEGNTFKNDLPTNDFSVAIFIAQRILRFE
jgi:hypothetical protein